MVERQGVKHLLSIEGHTTEVFSEIYHKARDYFLNSDGMLERDADVVTGCLFENPVPRGITRKIISNAENVVRRLAHLSPLILLVYSLEGQQAYALEQQKKEHEVTQETICQRYINDRRQLVEVTYHVETHRDNGDTKMAYMIPIREKVIKENPKAEDIKGKCEPKPTKAKLAN